MISRDTRCWLCGQRVLRYGGKSNPARPTTDHVVERRNGGADDFENYRLAHAWCNSIRADYPDPKLHPHYGETIKLRLKKAKIDKRVFELRASLAGAEPSSWRVVAVSADATLPQFYRTVQGAFEWTKYVMDAHFEFDGTVYPMRRKAPSFRAGI
ncbi:MAG TPA: HNH endonuclease [Candidatus Baltobacteraceae bacterium]|nr:HNH endonuclease [Candidatus Baltobacteraceae bacterium]